MTAVFFIILFPLIVAGIIYGAIAARKRREELSQLAARLGLDFSPEENHSLADQFNFLKLQQELINTEDRIQAARRFYNGNVRDYLNKCEIFPGSLVARMFNFSPREFFSVPPSVKEVPDVEFAPQPS